MKKSINQTPKFNKKIILLFLVLTLIIAAISTYYFESSKKKSGLEKIKVSLVWKHQSQFAGMYVAKEKGFYANEGLDVSIKEFNLGDNLEEELIRGEADFSVIHSEQLLNSVADGINIKAIASIYQKMPYAFLASSEKAIDEPSDFVGKTLGVKGDNPYAKLLYTVFLSEIGVDIGEVDFKPIDFSTTEFEDISSNSVDIIDLYRTDQVYLFDKNKVGYDLFLPEEFGFETYGDVIVTSADLIEQKPEVAQKFVNATLRGWKYALENQKEAVNLTEKYIVSDSYKDGAYNEFILSKSSPLIKPKRNQKIGKMEFLKWKNLYDVMESNGFFKNNFDVREAYTTQFLE